MDWVKRMNDAIKYIEENLTNEIDLEKVAKVACCSSYHFQRMFSFITETPLSEYIRRRRLTLAAFALQSSKEKIIDIALKYGYDSPNSFARAFQNLHGVTPNMARKKGVPLKSFPPLSFSISIKGDIEMNYRMEEKESCIVFGKSYTIGKEEDPYQVIPEFWMKLQEDGSYQRICNLAGFEPYSGVLLNGAIYDFPKDGSYRNQYLIYTALPTGVIVPSDLVTFTIPALKWVVFSETYDNPENCTEIIQGLWKRAYTEWFATSEYEIDEGPQLEVYPSDHEVEVWLPIIKK